MHVFFNDGIHQKSFMIQLDRGCKLSIYDTTLRTWPQADCVQRNWTEPFYNPSIWYKFLIVESIVADCSRKWLAWIPKGASRTNTKEGKYSSTLKDVINRKGGNGIGEVSTSLFEKVNEVLELSTNTDISHNRLQELIFQTVYSYIMPHIVPGQEDLSALTAAILSQDRFLNDVEHAITHHSAQAERCKLALIRLIETVLIPNWESLDVLYDPTFTSTMIMLGKVVDGTTRLELEKLSLVVSRLKLRDDSGGENLRKARDIRNESATRLALIIQAIESWRDALNIAERPGETHSLPALLRPVYDTFKRYSSSNVSLTAELQNKRVCKEIGDSLRNCRRRIEVQSTSEGTVNLGTFPDDVQKREDLAFSLIDDPTTEVGSNFVIFVGQLVEYIDQKVMTETERPNDENGSSMFSRKVKRHFEDQGQLLARHLQLSSPESLQWVQILYENQFYELVGRLFDRVYMLMYQETFELMKRHAGALGKTLESYYTDIGVPTYYKHALQTNGDQDRPADRDVGFRGSVFVEDCPCWCTLIQTRSTAVRRLRSWVFEAISSDSDRPSASSLLQAQSAMIIEAAAELKPRVRGHRSDSEITSCRHSTNISDRCVHSEAGLVTERISKFFQSHNVHVKLTLLIDCLSALATRLSDLKVRQGAGQVRGGAEIGTDDLLPSLVAVLLEMDAEKIGFLVVHLQMCADLLPDFLALGQYGWAITTLQAALHVLLTLNS